MVKEIICFAVGAAAGFGVATYFMKTKYEAMVEEETKNAMEWVKNRNSDEKTEEISHSEEVKKFNNIATNYNKVKERVESEGLIMDENKPYRISEGDFVVDDDEYGKVSLDYYTDEGALYEDDECISNVDEVVGLDNLNLLRGIDDDVIYVRNEKYKIDYEVSRIVGSYSEGNNYV